jgi:hypothetical protein
MDERLQKTNARSKIGQRITSVDVRLASREQHMVVQHLNAVLKRLHKESLPPSTNGIQESLMRTQEGSRRELSEYSKADSLDIPHTDDADGRQRICFFLDFAAHEQVPVQRNFKI